MPQFNKGKRTFLRLSFKQGIYTACQILVLWINCFFSQVKYSFAFKKENYILCKNLKPCDIFGRYYMIYPLFLKFVLFFVIFYFHMPSGHIRVKKMIEKNNICEKDKKNMTDQA